MLRRLLTLCLLLALTSALAWPLTHRLDLGHYVAGHTATDGFAFTAERGTVEAWLYVHKSEHRGRLQWSVGRYYHDLEGVEWWGTSDEGSGRIIFARFPLAVPTFAFAGLAVWIWRAGQVSSCAGI